MGAYHIPVMLDETLSLLDIKRGEWYVDCNLGGGGHTSGILEKGGNVLGIDLDPDAIAEVSKNQEARFKNQELILKQSNFSQIKEVVEELGIDNIKGVLFDLGVSSYQLEKGERGFSFNIDAPLDMRMDQNFGVSAKELVNGLHEKELADLFWKLGEEFHSRQIAKKIVEYRKKKPIETTNELAGIVTSVSRRNTGDRTHPATRVFQSLRIAVNDELNSLKEALPKAFEILEDGGKLVVISFHSLEDRIVKNYFKEKVDAGKATLLTKKPITPTLKEVEQNPRSRSGKLRAIEKKA